MDVRFTFLKDNDRDTAVYQAALDLLEPHIANPDPGSEFDYVVRSMGTGSPRSKIVRLMPQGFDALLGVKNEKVVSFLALKHKSARKPTAVFRVYTAPEYQRNGIARESVEHLVNACFRQGQHLLYVSRGKSEAVSAVLRSLQQKYQGPYELDVQPETGLITKRAQSLESKIIVISGEPGSGKSSIAKSLAQELGYGYFSGGDFRGEIARRHGMTIDELNEVGKKEIWPHKECDDLVKEYGGNKDKMVIDSWLAWHFIPNATKVFLQVDPQVGAERVFAHQREDEAQKKTVNDVREMLQKRWKDTNDSYIKWYNADMTKRENYDTVIDTTRLSLKAAYGAVREFVGSRLGLKF